MAGHSEHTLSNTEGERSNDCHELVLSEAEGKNIVLGKQSLFYATGEILRLRCAPAQNDRLTMTRYWDESISSPQSKSHAAPLAGVAWLSQVSVLWDNRFCFRVTNVTI